MAYKFGLINPNVRKVLDISEPLNIIELATYLKKNGINVKIIDENAGDDVIESVKSFNPDMVGFTSLTSTYPRTVRLLKTIKAFGYKTVIGGPHVSALPEKALEDGFDLVVVGEGEKMMLEIISRDCKKGIFKTPVEKTLKSKELLVPDRSLINMNFYIKTQHLSTRGTVARRASLMTIRGCPYRCIFCHNTWRDTPMRFMDIEAVFEAMEQLVKDYKIQHITFNDDDFFINKNRVVKFCELKLKKNIKISWNAMARADSLNEEIIALASRTGLNRIGFGFESGSQRILNILKKESNVEENLAVSRLCRKYRVKILGFFTIGNPTETEDDIRLTQEFIKKIKIDHIGICVLIPFPGTPLWKWCEEEGYIPEDVDFSQFHVARAPVQIPDTFTPEKVERIKRNTLIKAYLFKPELLRRFIYLLGRYPLHTFRIIFDHLSKGGFCNTPQI